VAPAELARRRCNTYGEEKPTSEFYKNSHRKAGFEHYCKPCWITRTTAYAKKHRAEANAARRIRRAAAGGAKWSLEDQLASRYGISVQELESLTAQQQGRCALCGDLPKFGKRLHVDHCHETGRVRGLLCLQCNAGLGQLRDDPALLRKAITYLEQ